MTVIDPRKKRHAVSQKQLTLALHRDLADRHFARLTARICSEMRATAGASPLYRKAPQLGRFVFQPAERRHLTPTQLWQFEMQTRNEGHAVAKFSLSYRAHAPRLPQRYELPAPVHLFQARFLYLPESCAKYSLRSGRQTVSFLAEGHPEGDTP